MPTYSVTSVEGCLDAPKRAKIASEITRIHSKTTGAPTYFAQVIFTEIAPGYYFVGGVPLKGHQVFVNGQVGGGRCAESRVSLFFVVMVRTVGRGSLQCGLRAVPPYQLIIKFSPPIGQHHHLMIASTNARIMH